MSRMVCVPFTRLALFVNIGPRRCSHTLVSVAAVTSPYPQLMTLRPRKLAIAWCLNNQWSFGQPNLCPYSENRHELWVYHSCLMMESSISLSSVKGCSHVWGHQPWSRKPIWSVAPYHLSSRGLAARFCRSGVWGETRIFASLSVETTTVCATYKIINTNKSLPRIDTWHIPFQHVHHKKKPQGKQPNSDRKGKCTKWSLHLLECHHCLLTQTGDRLDCEPQTQATEDC